MENSSPHELGPGGRDCLSQLLLPGLQLWVHQGYSERYAGRILNNLQPLTPSVASLAFLTMAGDAFFNGLGIAFLPVLLSLDENSISYPETRH